MKQIIEWTSFSQKIDLEKNIDTSQQIPEHLLTFALKHNSNNNERSNDVCF